MTARATSAGLSIYFGTELPERSWARQLHGADVVLEPYHPLVKYGGFAETFPSARRYVYVNPTTIDPWELERTDNPPPVTGRDEQWGLPRLDLDRPEALEWAVRSAAAAFALDDAQSTGLFVDDLDRMLPERAELVIEYLARVALACAREPRWFVNRAFGLWQRIEALDAVLLEDLTPEVIGAGTVDESRWMRDVVFPAIRTARSRGVRIHSLSYDDQADAPTAAQDGLAPDLALQDELRQLVDSVTTGADRPLHVWRTNR